VKVLPTVLAVVAAALLQVTLAPSFAIGGIVPNVLFLVVTTLALAEGPVPGASAGFAAGLVYDMLGSGPIGPMALVLTVVGYLAGLLHEQMFAEGWLLPLTVLGVAALGTETAYGLVLGLIGEGAPFWASLVTRVLPAAVYNTVLALLVYPWLARFLRRDHPMTTFRRLG